MGKMSEPEKIGAVILGVVFFPFFVAKEFLHWTGILPREQHEWKGEENEE